MRDKIFLDTNVLIYLSCEESLFHKTSVDNFKEIKEHYELWTSTQVLREYAVVMTRKDFVEKPLTNREIINDLNIWMQTLSICGENVENVKILNELIKKYKVAGKRIHDANIVAAMIANEIKLLWTYNVNDFRSFKEIKLFKTRLS